MEPNKSPAYQDDPHIPLCGKLWPIPLLAPRQNRKVIPRLMKLRTLKFTQDLTEEQYDDLIDIVYMALTRAHPELKREEILDWPISSQELLQALPIIAQQTGMVVRQETTGPLELPVVEAPISQTGTES